MSENLFDLAAKISVDNAGVDSGLTQTQRRVLDLAKQFEVTEAAAKKSAVGMATSMAAVNAEIGKMKTANLVSDYDKFSNALKNNSTNARKAADDFLNLLGTTKSHTGAAHEAEAASHKLSEGLRAIASSAVIVDGPLGGVAGRLRAVGAETTELTGLFGPLGILIAGITVGAGGLALVVFELAKKAAEAGKEIFEVSEKTNLGTETVSAFKVAAELEGTTIERVGNKLAGFNVVMGQAAMGNKTMIKTLKDAGVTSKNTEEAIGQYLKKFQEMGPTTQRNALEAKLFRDRTGELIPLLIRMGGSIEEAKKQAYDLGVSFDEVGAKRAKEFADKLEIARLGVQGLEQQIGMRSIPAIEAALNDLAKALGVNENTWRGWGEYLGNVMSGVVVEASAMAAAVAASLNQAKGIGTRAYQDLKLLGPTNKEFWSPKENYDLLQRVLHPVQQFGTYGPSASEAYNTERTRMLAQIANRKLPAPSGVSTYSGGGAGGGRRGGGDPAVAERRLADLRLKAVLDGLKAEDEANKRSLDRRWEDFDHYAGRYNVTENKRHAAVIAGLNEEMAAAEKVRKPQEREIAIQQVRNKQIEEESTHTRNSNKVLDERAKLLDQLNDFIERQTLDIGFARSNTDQYDRAVAELEVQLRKAGVTEIDYALDIARTNAQTQKAIDLAKQLTRERRVIYERPRFVEDKNFPQSVGIEMDETGATRKRRATHIPDWLYSILPGGDAEEKLHAAADNIASILGKGIHDGFDQGIKEGLRSMALGFLQMIEQMAQQWLASSIFKMLQGAFTPGAGGTTGGVVSGGGGFLGFLSKILPFVGSLFGGVTIGGGSPAGGYPSTGGHLPPSGHAMGLDYVPYDNYPALLHRGERVMTASENAEGGAPVVHNHYWNIVTQDARSFMGQDTQRQIAQRMNKFQLHAQLTG